MGGLVHSHRSVALKATVRVVRVLALRQWCEAVRGRCEHGARRCERCERANGARMVRAIGVTLLRCEDFQHCSSPVSQVADGLAVDADEPGSSDLNEVFAKLGLLGVLGAVVVVASTVSARPGAPLGVRCSGGTPGVVVTAIVTRGDRTAEPGDSLLGVAEFPASAELHASSRSRTVQGEKSCQLLGVRRRALPG